MTDTVKKGFFYSKEFACRFCSSTFTVWRLYPTVRNQIEKLDEYFDVAYYKAPDPAAPFCDYLLVEVRVCPDCAFSTNDDTQFAGGSWDPDQGEIDAIRAQAGARRKMASSVDLQSFPREVANAEVSFKLGIHCATTLYNVAPRRNAIEIARMGNYALKAAMICDRLGQPDRVDTWRRAALEYFRRAMESEIMGSPWYRTLYQVGALGIHYGDDHIAAKAFEKLRAIKTREPVRDLTRYLERLRKIWEDRDYNRAKK